MANIQDTSCGKMSQGPSPQTKEKISGVSLRQSAKSKTKPPMFLNLKSGTLQEKSWETISPLPGESSMLNFGESPNEENESTLSQILIPNAPIKYYLSPRACLGILRRASARGKELPAVLRIALERQAADLMDTTEV